VTSIRDRLLALVGATVLLTAVTATVGQGVARAECALPAGNTAQQWDQIAVDTVTAVGKVPFQNEGLLYMAYVNGSVYDAVMSITGGYAPYGPTIAAEPDASPDAAIAAAAYDTLAYYVGTNDVLDCQRDLALADGSDATMHGADVGHAAAAAMIEARTGDGRQTPFGITSGSVPAAGPGVWQPTPPTYASPQTPWVGEVRPFILETPDQYLPPPPPPLMSRVWANEYNEIKLWGAGDSSVRTQEQTDIALFWSTNVIRQYNAAFRQVASQHSLDLLQTTRLIGEGSLVAADAQIACMNAKYDYWFWRPVTAINPTARPSTASLDDGNPRTTEQAGWLPLLGTPNHPEYPAAHGCLTSAMAEVFSQFLGTTNIDLTITSTTVATMPTRHFDTAAQLRTEIINARLWAGLHYRGSSEQGVKLGQKVARYDLAHAFEPIA